MPIFVAVTDASTKVFVLYIVAFRVKVLLLERRVVNIPAWTCNCPGESCFLKGNGFLALTVSVDLVSTYFNTGSFYSETFCSYFSSFGGYLSAANCFITSKGFCFTTDSYAENG